MTRKTLTITTTTAPFGLWDALADVLDTDRAQLTVTGAGTALLSCDGDQLADALDVLTEQDELATIDVADSDGTPNITIHAAGA